MTFSCALEIKFFCLELSFFNRSKSNDIFTQFWKGKEVTVNVGAT